MRFVKLGLISVVFFCLLLTAISSLLPSSINIVRSVDILAPASTIHPYINNVQNWAKWYSNYDSTKASFSAKKTGEGASITIDKTTVTITKSDADHIEAIWESPGTKPLNGDFNFVKSDGIITLQWRINYNVKWYPWQKFGAVFSDKAFGPFMEKSLENLKHLAESPE